MFFFLGKGSWIDFMPKWPWVGMLFYLCSALVLSLPNFFLTSRVDTFWTGQSYTAFHAVSLLGLNVLCWALCRITYILHWFFQLQSNKSMFGPCYLGNNFYFTITLQGTSYYKYYVEEPIDTGLLISFQCRNYRCAIMMELAGVEYYYILLTFLFFLEIIGYLPNNCSACTQLRRPEYLTSTAYSTC